MAKWVCKLCKLDIRRPVDHVYCLGALDYTHLEEREQKKARSTREITRDIVIPPQVRDHKLS
jgi:hypothetical protein